MTVAQVGSSTNSTTANGTQCSVSKPSGVASGHLIILTFLSNDQNASFPSGFTEFQDTLTGVFRLQAAWKIAGSSEGSSYTVSVGSDGPLVLSCTAWSGADVTNPLYAGSVAVSSSAVNEAEPLTGPTTGTIPVARGQKLYLRACRSTTAIPTFSTAAGGVTEIADIGVYSGGTVRYALGWYKDNSNVGYDARTTQAGIGITCSTTETNNISQTYVITAAIETSEVTATGTANAPQMQTNAGHATGTGEAFAPLVFTGREATYGVKVDWNNDGDFSDTGENITARTLASKGPLSFQYGRDQARAVDAIRPAETAFTVNNESGDYAPDNLSSPLAGNLEPGKPILITGELNGNVFNLFRGFLDNYKVVPSNKDVNNVQFTGLDVLYRLREAVLSTPIYESLQTGEAIHVLLDEVGWPEADRDIDQGATTLRWWWEEGTNGLDALAKIVGSEGPAAFAFVDGDGKLVFRDRHHRYFRTASKEIQATFRASGTEPLFSEPMEYEAGWRDLINQVVIEVGEREPSLFTVVWSTETPIVLEPGESVTLDVKTDTPFYNAITPTFGLISTNDITFRSGSSVEVLLSRDSGQSTKIILTGDSSAVISKLQLRAQLLPVARTLKIIAEDTDSIAKHGVRTLQQSRAVWANAHDALAIASIIVSQRSKRLPVVHITVKNANASRMIEILSRDLSDRIHIVEPTNSIDDDFFIEQIKHTVSHAGKLHEAVFGCERAVSNNDAVQPNYFTFGKAGSGFDQGVFGEDGFLESSLVFVLDDSETGRLDVGGLGF